ncbi:MAG: protein kinase [Planctomycetota bacterium]
MSKPNGEDNAGEYRDSEPPTSQSPPRQHGPMREVNQDQESDGATLLYDSRADDASFINPDEKNPALKAIDRYAILHELGTGGFGRVFLAHDPRLNRNVAIKIPRLDRPIDQTVWDQFVSEARAVSNLKHPAIIPVYDVDRTSEWIPYVVMEFVEGGTLRDVCRGRPDASYLVQLIRQVAEGLRFAHEHCVVHRDLKPSNIMIDGDGHARIADFGLAIHDDMPLHQLGKGLAGTLKFMSPEQLRRETHRLDGRTDIWSLGVVLYWAFTLRYPFVSETYADLLVECTTREPKPIRQINEAAPLEIDRICARCLAPLMPERYQSAAELIEDLFFLEKSLALGNSMITESAAPSRPNPVEVDADSDPKDSRLTVVPKGLRSFDSGDAEFFLSLLPGPRDRFGVPDSIRFWVQRLTSTDLELPIGLIYGPSGSGKSSFVRAGLIPRLPRRFRHVYIACSKQHTETDLRRSLRKHVHLPPESDNQLSDLLRRARKGLRSGSKLLIVLDQFEQWLDVGRENASAELVEALRQCDGENLQCLLLVRDDFWLPTQSFLRHLDEQIQDGTNSRPLQLFDLRHSRKVLTAFGRAYGALPGSDELSRQEKRFVDQVVDRLSEDRKVIPAHIALFADIMKDRDWGGHRLDKAGGLEAFGISYLEEQFSAKHAAVDRRHRLPLVKSILSELIPESGASIKASALTEQELAVRCLPVQSQVAGDENPLAPILDVLEVETRVLTRVAEEEPPSGDGASAGGISSSHATGEVSDRPAVRYQLTHDILVGPVRRWLTQQQRESWTGRAELCLKAVTQEWTNSSDSRRLPPLLEYASILFGTSRSRYSAREKSLIHAADRYYLSRVLCLAVFVAVLSVTWLAYRNQLDRQAARTQIRAALDANHQAVGTHLAMLRGSAEHVPALLTEIDSQSLSPSTRLRFDYLRAHYGEEPAGDVAAALLDQIDVPESNACANFVAALEALASRSVRSELLDELSRRIGNAESLRGKVRLAIVQSHLGVYDGLKHCLQDRTRTALRTVFVDEFSHWRDDLHGFLPPPSTLQEHELLCVCKAVAGVDPSSFSETEIGFAKSWLQATLERASTGGLIVASLHALRMHAAEDFEAIRRVAMPQSGAFQTVVVAVGEEVHPIEFVEIPAGQAQFAAGAPDKVQTFIEGASSQVSESFYLASREVSAKLFFAFVDDSTTPVEIRKTFASHPLRALQSADLPMYRVSRNHAAQFCNWLSQRQGLPPAYLPARLGGEEDWAPNDGSGGFRLPSLAEWDIAARAYSETAFFFGDRSLMPLVNRYAWSSVESLPYPTVEVGPRGVKLPNDFGVYDLLGNAGEWTHDRLVNFELYAVRGGDVRCAPFRLRSAEFIPVIPSDTSQNGGVRLVIPTATLGRLKQ